jgi:hypothetical protein
MNSNHINSLQQRFKFGTKKSKSSSGSSSNNVSPNTSQNSNNVNPSPIQTVSASVSAKDSTAPHLNFSNDHSNSLVAINPAHSSHNRHISFEPLPFPNYSLFEESYGEQIFSSLSI